MTDEIAAANNRVVQLRLARPDALTSARRKRFLDVLATTCNVTMAATAAGASPSAFYYLRRRDADFDALWREAIALGYEQLEEALLSKALSDVNAMEVEPSAIEICDSTRQEPPADIVDIAPAGSDARVGGVAAASALAKLDTRSRPQQIDPRLALALLLRRRPDGPNAAGRTGRGRHRTSPEDVARAIDARLDKLAARQDRHRDG